MKASTIAIGLVSLAIILGACGSDNDNTAVTEANTTMSEDNTATSEDGTVSVTTTLVGEQEVPPVASTATGTANITLETTSGALSGQITHNVADATVAHVHTGAVGVSGGPIVSLTRSSDTVFDVPEGAVLTTEQISEFVAGDLYVNVHSAEHPAGEIRGQLTNDTITPVTQATLDNIQATVFTPTCSGCHSGLGNTLPGVMNLSTAQASFDSLISVASLNEPDFERVTPSNAQDSYLVQKLEGRQLVGSRMPQGGAALSSETVTLIREWIDKGAVP